ncbi:MAG: dipeptide ABC transporter ATP-binding protein [Syntrophales bacterium]|nr:dipeptide ABC transporter ATP-binding protein [Syntrophales bacterium]
MTERSQNSYTDALETRSPDPESSTLVEMVNLKKYFHLSGGLFSRRQATVKAVDGLSLNIIKGETLGLVGESGCGKTTLGRMLSRLEEPTEGIIRYGGEEITALTGENLKNFRKRVQFIFQDPYSSLNPRMNAGAIVGESLGIHNIAGGKERRMRVIELMEKVGLTEEQTGRYPHEFSGGQRQRIGIARALSVSPDLIIADEPVSALDVSIQAQILNLLSGLQDEFNLTYLFISHDLGVVGHMSDRIGVMYLGKIVESCGRKKLFQNPCHPYTMALLAAVPVPDPGHKKKRLALGGDIPSPFDPPAGCSFHPRCPFRMAICSEVQPELKQRYQGHFAACHLAT